MRIHPIYILEAIKKFIFLLIIPLLRGGIHYIINGNWYIWLKGSWIDIAIIMIILGLSIVSWYNYKFYFNNNTLNLIYGIFIKKNIIIDKKNLCCVTVYSPIYYKPVKAVRLTFYTLNNKKNSKISILVSQANFNYLKTNILNDTCKNKNLTTNISVSKTLQSILLSLIMSNSLAGIVIVSTFISTSSKILGYQLENHLYGPFTIITKKLAFGFPPAGAAIAYILLIGWVVAFIKNLLCYINFNLNKCNNKLITFSGLINTKIEYIDIEKIIYIDIIQNIFTKITNLYSIFIDVGINKKHKKQLVAITPSIRKNALVQNIYNIFNIKYFDLYKMKIKPSITSIFTYLRFPIILFSIFYFICHYLSIKYSSWSSFLNFIILMSGIICFWLLIVKFIDLLTCGISLQNSSYIIRYSSYFKLHTVIISKDKISKIKIRQTLIQKYYNQCDILIYTCLTNNIKYRCKNISMSKIDMFINNLH